MSYYADDTVTVWHGDCLDVLATLPDASVDAVVTDPPYGLEFMGKEWDSFGRQDVRQPGDETFQAVDNPYGRGKVRYGTAASYGKDGAKAMRAFQAWCELWATECLRVLKPGGHLLAFGGTRTSHRLACAIEDAGFEIRDSIAWLYGSGFPKSLDVSKAIDKAAGAEREVVGPTKWQAIRGVGKGWGTALKPAHEPVVVARKPLSGTVAQTVLEHGTGALNIDGCRVGSGDNLVRPAIMRTDNDVLGAGLGAGVQDNPAGRWPANESQAAALDQQSGEQRDRGNTSPTRRDADTGRTVYGAFGGTEGPVQNDPEGGGASRFFYVAREDESCTRNAAPADTEWTNTKTEERESAEDRTALVTSPRFLYTAKADAAERVRIDGTAHPTVKPLALMQWLVRLVTPPGGTVLEPFAGSGATVEACILEGFRCVAIEREADYLPLILQRVHRRRDPVAAVKATGVDGGLFDLLGEDDEEPACQIHGIKRCTICLKPAGGRWPPNVVMDASQAAELDRQSGELAHNPPATWRSAGAGTDGDGTYAAGVGKRDADTERSGFDDRGGASRFFPVFDDGEEPA